MMFEEGARPTLLWQVAAYLFCERERERERERDRERDGMSGKKGQEYLFSRSTICS